MSLPRSASRRRTQRGSGVLEGAIVMLGFMAIILGVFDFARAAFAYTQVQWLAGDGARYAALRGSTYTTPATSSSVSTYVSGNAVGLTTSSLTVTTTWATNNNPGSTVNVKVAYTMTPMLIPFLGSSLNVLGADTLTILD